MNLKPDVMSALERRVEADLINLRQAPLTEKELVFLEKITNPRARVSPNQLQYLRDIEEKYRENL